jgi:SSS family solute:Na+ symporter
VLPTVLTALLPAWIGALALAAVFSTEVDTCDAILFMISTSASKDLYKRYFRPDATDRQLLLVARGSAVAGGTLGVLLSVYLSTIVSAMTVFYSLLGVSLFVPVLGGLYSRRAGSAEALGSIAAGVATLLVVRFGFAGRHVWLDPTLTGLAAAAAVFYLILLVRSTRT